MGDAPPKYQHVYISTEPIAVGKMHGADSYKFFVSLCIAFEEIERNSEKWDSYHRVSLITFRRDLSVKEHWHSLVKPACEHCCLLQAMLHANFKKADRLTVDREQLRTLMQKYESENHP